MDPSTEQETGAGTAANPRPMVYVSHATCFDYKAGLYTPLRAAGLHRRYQLVLPHDDRDEPVNSKEIIGLTDVMLCEVSWPSTGQGIEVGWAEAAGTPVACVHRSSVVPSRSLRIVTDVFVAYDAPDQIAAAASEAVGAALARSPLS